MVSLKAEVIINIYEVTPDNIQTVKIGFNFDWEGGLKEISSEYISVKLQHILSNLVNDTCL